LCRNIFAVKSKKVVVIVVDFSRSFKMSDSNGRKKQTKPQTNAPRKANTIARRDSSNVFEISDISALLNCFWLPTTGPIVCVT